MVFQLAGMPASEARAQTQGLPQDTPDQQAPEQDSTTTSSLSGETKPQDGSTTQGDASKSGGDSVQGQADAQSSPEQSSGTQGNAAPTEARGQTGDSNSASGAQTKQVASSQSAGAEQPTKDKDAKSESTNTEAASTKTAAAPAMPAFDQSVQAGGTTVRVSVLEGVFPEGARLQVTEAGVAQKAFADLLVYNKKQNNKAPATTARSAARSTTPKTADPTPAFGIAGLLGAAVLGFGVCRRRRVSS